VIPDFSLWILKQLAEDLTFKANVSFVEKYRFIVSGITNIHNELLWSDENARGIRSNHRQ
jgi:hypothetical protein